MSAEADDALPDADDKETEFAARLDRLDRRSLQEFRKNRQLPSTTRKRDEDQVYYAVRSIMPAGGTVASGGAATKEGGTGS
jgi:hypothetical protein